MNYIKYLKQINQILKTQFDDNTVSFKIGCILGLICVFIRDVFKYILAHYIPICFILIAINIHRIDNIVEMQNFNTKTINENVRIYNENMDIMLKLVERLNEILGGKK